MRIVQRSPGVLGHGGVQARQHDDAVRQTGDHPQQSRHRRNAARGAGSQHSLDRRCRIPGGSLRVEQGDQPCRRVHQALLGQPVRPASRDDVQELERLRPVRGEGGIGGLRQPARQIDLRPLRLVHQRREFGGQRPGTIGGARRAVRAVHPQDQQRQRRQSLRRLHRRRQVERAGQRQRRLVEPAKRRDPRQKQRSPARGAQERVGERAGGAPCRQQDQPSRHRQRVVARTAQPLGRQRVEERHTGRDGEQVQRVSPVESRLQDGLGLGQVRRRGEMEPQPVMHHRAQPAGRHRGVPGLVHAEGSIGRAGEQRGCDELQAGIDIGCHLALAATAWRAPGVQREVAEADVGAHLEGAVDQQHAIDLGRIECGDQPRERRPRAVHPERVAVDHEEWRGAQQVERRLHAAAGLQQRGLAAQDGARAGARREMRGDPVGVPVGVHHDGLHARLGQPIERVVDQRPAAERQQRLGGAVGERAHAGADTGGQQHGGARGHAARSGGLQRRSGGIQRSSAAASGRGDRLAHGLLQQAPGARAVHQVTGPAIAPGEAHPLADNPQVSLRGARGIGGAECRRVQFGPRGQVVGDGVFGKLAAGCRGARPAAARRDRRPGDRSRRPGSRARRCGECRCAAAARAGCRRRSRDGRSKPDRPRPAPAWLRVPRRSPGGRRRVRSSRTWRATTSRTTLPERWLPCRCIPGREVAGGGGALHGDQSVPDGSNLDASWRYPLPNPPPVHGSVPMSDDSNIVPQIFLQQQPCRLRPPPKISGADTPIPARCRGDAHERPNVLGRRCVHRHRGTRPAGQSQIATETGVLGQRFGPRRLITVARRETPRSVSRGSC